MLRSTDGVRRPKQLSIAVWSALAVTFVCSFLPWIALGPMSVAGTAPGRDGKVTEPLAVCAGVLFLGRELTNQWLRVFLCVLSCATAAFGLAVYGSNLVEVSRSIDTEPATSFFEVSVGLNFGTAASAIAVCLLLLAAGRDVWAGAHGTLERHREQRRGG